LHLNQGLTPSLASSEHLDLNISTNQLIRRSSNSDN